MKKPHFAVFSRLMYTVENPLSYFPNSFCETVWKIQIGVKLEPGESVKRSEEAQSLPRCATKDVPSRPLQPISKQFLEKLSEKGTSNAPSVDLAGIRRPNWAEKHRFGGP